MLIAFSIVLLVILAVDIYGWYGLRKLLHHGPFSKYRKKILRAYWIMDISFIVFAIVWTIIIRTSSWPDYVMYRNYFYITGAFILIFAPKFVFLVFNILDDLKLLLLFVLRKIMSGFNKGRERMIRTYPLMLTTGFFLSLFMFGWVVYGVVYGRFNFQVKEVTVEIDDLPESFDGFRLVHITDTHFGSFARKRPVERALRKIEKLPKDALMFTGDMVNNEAVEAERFIEAFQRLNPPYGMYSVLGNHDMGDYRRWYTIEERDANLDRLMEIQEEMGFNLLRNNHRFIRRGNDSIMIVGVDNWGLPPFHQLGDLEEALGDYPWFRNAILLSHDPSHWREEVLPETNIMLTLSGHTHGFQAGIRLPFLRWSPVSLRYPEWNGLYREDNQFMYINRGLGFIGFPGRMGMRPEITLITLRRG
ncbi:MAG: metallophosphoesterase [Bacteroidetes bacterium]|nr:MAG: metallophosphoesterase [Bacteroidota bacterium]